MYCTKPSKSDEVSELNSTRLLSAQLFVSNSPIVLQRSRPNPYICLLIWYTDYRLLWFKSSMCVITLLTIVFAAFFISWETISPLHICPWFWECPYWQWCICWVQGFVCKMNFFRMLENPPSTPTLVSEKFEYGYI